MQCRLTSNIGSSSGRRVLPRLAGLGAALATAGSLAAAIGPSAAAEAPQRRVTGQDAGKRVPVCARDLTVRESPGGRTIGSLHGATAGRQAQTFTVRSAGTWVSGHAWGDLNRDGWVLNGWFCPPGNGQTAGHAAAVASSARTARTYPRNWMMPTHLSRACRVHANYPKAGVPRRTWPLRAGAHVKVRYNVNGGKRYRDPETHRPTVTGWALVQDTARAEHKPNKINPHYGFIRRSCLTDQLPLPPLTGIGHNRQPRTVHFNPIGNGHRIRTLRVRGNPTMRDAVHAFAIGNLSSRHHDTFVIGTRRCRVSNRRSYVHGYAPAARRWGYVEASHLSGCRTHHG